MAAEVGEAGLRSCCIIENTSKSSKNWGKRVSSRDLFEDSQKGLCGNVNEFVSR